MVARAAGAVFITPLCSNHTTWDRGYIFLNAAKINRWPLKMPEIKQHLLQCLIQSRRPKRKMNSRGKNLSAVYSLRWPFSVVSIHGEPETGCWRSQAVGPTWWMYVKDSWGLRKMPTFRDATIGWHRRNKQRNSILIWVVLPGLKLTLLAARPPVWHFCACSSDIISRGNELVSWNVDCLIKLRFSQLIE